MIEAGAARQLAALAATVEKSFGGEPHALILHGSLAMNCFNPAGSDVDLLLVTGRRPAPEPLREFACAVLESSLAPYPVEISGLARDHLARAGHPYPFYFHFSESWREATARWVKGGEPPDLLSGDPDLAMHFLSARARGRSLIGPPPTEVLPEPPREAVVDSLVREWLWAVRPGDRNPVYAILNHCRALRYLSDGAVSSKVEGGLWALETGLGDPAAIAWALAAYRGQELGAPPDPAAFFDRTDRLLSDSLGCGVREWLSGTTGGEPEGVGD